MSTHPPIHQCRPPPSMHWASYDAERACQLPWRPQGCSCLLRPPPPPTRPCAHAPVPSRTPAAALQSCTRSSRDCQSPCVVRSPTWLSTFWPPSCGLPTAAPPAAGSPRRPHREWPCISLHIMQYAAYTAIVSWWTPSNSRPHPPVPCCRELQPLSPLPRRGQGPPPPPFQLLQQPPPASEAAGAAASLAGVQAMLEAVQLEAAHIEATAAATPPGGWGDLALPLALQPPGQRQAQQHASQQQLLECRRCNKVLMACVAPGHYRQCWLRPAPMSCTSAAGSVARQNKQHAHQAKKDLRHRGGDTAPV